VFRAAVSAPLASPMTTVNEPSPVIALSPSGAGLSLSRAIGTGTTELASILHHHRGKSLPPLPAPPACPLLRDFLFD
jgi:hypothetical protein